MERAKKIEIAAAKEVVFLFKALACAALTCGLVFFGYKAYYASVISNAVKKYATEFPKSYRINTYGLSFEEQDELRRAEAYNSSLGYQSFSRSDNVPDPSDDELKATPIVLGMNYEKQFQKRAEELTSEKGFFTFKLIFLLILLIKYGWLFTRWAYKTSSLE